MAATYVADNSVDITDGAVFIPEIWSNEVLAAYKQNLVMAALVMILNHRGKKGDTIHIPRPARAAASVKTPNQFVDPIAFTATDKAITITEHYHYARLIEDIAEMQALASMRQFFTNDAGYALAKQVDTALINLAATWGAGTAYSEAVIGGNGSTNWVATGSGNGTPLTDAGFRRVIQTFDDADVPGRDRVFVIPPVVKNTLLGTTRFTEQAFVGEVGMGNSIRNGLVGDLYGVEIFVSSNIHLLESAGDSTDYRVPLMFQKDALVLVEQLAPRVQQDYKLEALGTMTVADTIYGTGTVRGDLAPDSGAGCQAIVVPA